MSPRTTDGEGRPINLRLRLNFASRDPVDIAGCSTFGSGDPVRHLQRFHYQIRYGLERIGHARAVRFIQSNCSPMETANEADAINDDLTAAASFVLEEERFNDVLYIERVEVIPEWRGLRIGLLAARALVIRHGHAADVLGWPWPPMIEREDETVMQRAATQLDRYWSALHMERVKRGDRLYHLGENEIWDVPSVDELLHADPGSP